MKTILTKKELRQIKGGNDGDVYLSTVKCSRGAGAYDTCCDSPADVSGQACCERKHCANSVFLYVVTTGSGNCFNEPVSDLCA